MIIGIVIGLTLGILGSMGVLTILRRQQHHQTLVFLAAEFIRAAARHFDTLSQAQTPEVWQTRRGKITVPPELAASYWALKQAFHAAGRRRTPAGHRLVVAALALLKWDDPNNLTDILSPRLFPNPEEVHTL
ncbi:MAG: hypothetical protein WC600_17035 [Desulfobaccales bacterium]